MERIAYPVAGLRVSLELDFICLEFFLPSSEFLSFQAECLIGKFLFSMTQSDLY